MLEGLDCTCGVVLDCSYCTTSTLLDIFYCDEFWELRVVVGELVKILDCDRLLFRHRSWQLLCLVFKVPVSQWNFSSRIVLSRMACCDISWSGDDLSELRYDRIIFRMVYGNPSTKIPSRVYPVYTSLHPKVVVHSGSKYWFRVTFDGILIFCISISV